MSRWRAGTWRKAPSYRRASRGDSGNPGRSLPASVAVMRGVRLTGMMQRVVTAGTAPDAEAGWTALPGTAESVAVARRLVTRALAGCPRSDDLVLAVSELATNAVAWSASGEGGTFLVRVRRVTLWARVEVVDDGPASAAPAVPSPAAGAPAQPSANGYGLLLVREVTDRCGTTFTAGRRTSWAECTWTL